MAAIKQWEEFKSGGGGTRRMCLGRGRRRRSGRRRSTRGEEAKAATRIFTPIAKQANEDRSRNEEQTHRGDALHGRRCQGRSKKPRSRPWLIKLAKKATANQWSSEPRL